jgi:hypothetical protein
MLQAQLSIHLFQTPIFCFQSFEPLNLGSFQPAILGLPLVKAAFANPVLAA